MWSDGAIWWWQRKHCASISPHDCWGQYLQHAAQVCSFDKIINANVTKIQLFFPPLRHICIVGTASAPLSYDDGAKYLADVLHFLLKVINMYLTLRLSLCVCLPLLQL